MEPFTISLLSTAAFWAVKRWRETRQKSAGLPDPPVFSPVQILGFTHLVRGGREFDPDFTEALLRVLEQRSAKVLPPASLGLPPTFGATIYRVGLPAEGAPSAAKVIRDGQADALTVLGSLSLRMATAGVADAMLIVVGPVEVEGMAAPTQRAPDGTVHQGFFALFPSSPALEVAAAAPTEPAPAPAPEAAPPSASNGTAAPSSEVDMSKWSRVGPGPKEA